MDYVLLAMVGVVGFVLGFGSAAVTGSSWRNTLRVQVSTLAVTVATVAQHSGDGRIPAQFVVDALAKMEQEMHR